jgi:hypothetical protein
MNESVSAPDVGARSWRKLTPHHHRRVVARKPLWDQRPGLFLFLPWRSRSPLVHAGASLAGNDSAPASATGSNAGDVLFCSSRIFGLRFVGMRVFFLLMSPALASWVTAAAVDVRRVFHGFALRAAIAAAFGCHAGARWMRAFVRFSLSHISLPSLDRICLRSIDLLLFDAPAALRAPLPPEALALLRSAARSVCPDNAPAGLARAERSVPICAHLTVW